MLFVGFFFVRKLIESDKVTDKCARSSVAMLRRPILRSRQVSSFSRHDLRKDLENDGDWLTSRVAVRQVCDEVIHAWWITELRNEGGGLEAYIFTTDRKNNPDRKKKTPGELLWLPVSSVVETFKRFAYSEITKLQMKRSDTGELTYRRAE